MQIQIQTGYWFIVFWSKNSEKVYTVLQNVFAYLQIFVLLTFLLFGDIKMWKTI